MKKECGNCHYFYNESLTRRHQGFCYLNPPVVSDFLVKMHYKNRQYFDKPDPNTLKPKDLEVLVENDISLGVLQDDFDTVADFCLHPAVWHFHFCGHWKEKENEKENADS